MFCHGLYGMNENITYAYLYLADLLQIRYVTVDFGLMDMLYYEEYYLSGSGTVLNYAKFTTFDNAIFVGRI